MKGFRGLLLAGMASLVVAGTAAGQGSGADTGDLAKQAQNPIAAKGHGHLPGAQVPKGPQGLQRRRVTSYVFVQFGDIEPQAFGVMLLHRAHGIEGVAGQANIGLYIA